MKLREYLQKLINDKSAQADELRAQIKKAETADEVRALGDTLNAVLSELAEAKEQLDAMDEGEEESERAQIPANAELRGGAPIASFATEQQTRKDEDVLGSMEYRQAFAQYVRTGEWNYRGTDEIITVDPDVIGKVIPNTVMTEFIKELKSYGQLYNRVRKMNVKGGVEFPIEDLVPTVSWITENTVSNTQKAPELKTSVSFGYHVAEARIAQSLLASVVTLDVLESEIARLLAEAFIKEFDAVIVAGSGSGQPTGILNDERVPEGNKITMTATNAVKWDEWRKQLFAKIPLAYRGGGVLLMTVDTWESLIMTMKDTNDRPLYSETYDVATGETICRFNGKEVILVESDLGLYDYSTATSGQAYMIYFKPESYAINSNLQVGFKRYFNEDSNKWINKGLCIMDGKLLDTNGVFIVSK